MLWLLMNNQILSFATFITLTIKDMACTLKTHTLRTVTNTTEHNRHTFRKFKCRIAIHTSVDLGMITFVGSSMPF